MKRLRNRSQMYKDLIKEQWDKVESSGEFKKAKMIIPPQNPYAQNINS